MKRKKYIIEEPKLEDLNLEEPQYNIFYEVENWIDKKFSNPNATIRLATMFSGIGSIEHALKRLNLNEEIVFACDNDKYVKQSYFANYEISESSWYDDVKEIDGTKYEGKIDLLVGGSPCQSFSMVGKRKGFEDTRGTLFYEFARVVKESQPKIFIFENVKGLVSHDKGNTFDVIKETFNELGYHFKFKLLNSKNFGIPQHRERIFIVGFKDTNVEFEFPEAIPLEYKMQDFLEDYIDSKYYLKEKGVKFVTGALKDIDGDSLRDLCDKLRDKLGSGVVVLGSSVEGKVQLVAMSTKDAVSAGVHCGKIIKEVAAITGGGGGGRADMAQAGGKNPEKLQEALETVEIIMGNLVK